MDAHTLFTFTLQAPAEVRVVDLYGSWDNFSRPWPLLRDSLRGRGFWTACHKFENIIYDGVTPDFIQPRNGALKQGGRYWYFYRFDDDDENVDPAEPTSADCPLLPGQRLNVLDMPIEMVEPLLPRGRSASVSLVPFSHHPAMTLDPEDRFRKITRRPAKLMRHYASSDGLESIPSPQRSSRTSSASSRIDSASSVLPVDSVIDARSQQSPTLSGREMEMPLTPTSWPFSSAMSSPAPLVPFAPSSRTAELARPPTRLGSPSGSSRSGQSFFTVESKLSSPSTKPLPALPRSPARYQLATQDCGLGISLHRDAPSESPQPVLRSKSSRNFARPFYALRPSAATSPPLPSDDDEMDFVPTGSAQTCHTPTSLSLASPTFSADTISTPGTTTPHRLSATFHFNLHAEPLDLSLGHTDSAAVIRDVERRLSRMHTGDAEEQNDRCLDEGIGRAYDRAPPPFSRRGEAAESDVPAAKKTASAGQGVFIVDAPGLEPLTGGRQRAVSPGLAGSIFGELGFLGRAIN